MRSVSGITKFTLCMVACIILALGLTSCGGNGKAESDTTAPTATSSLSTTAATNGSVTITVTATDNLSGVASIKLPGGSVVPAATATYTVSANGTYSFVITDKAGNTATLPVTVSNIDTIAPTATSVLSETDPDATNGTVTITVTASDNVGVASITLPNSTVVLASTATYDVTANGTYNFTITDKAGNTLALPVAVSSILSLKAGAGAATIDFPIAMFATKYEGFDGTIHDAPHARVMVLETNSKVAIVSLELVRTDADGVALVKQIVSDITGTPKNNIWVHSNHTITTPHEPPDATQLGLFMDALRTATTKAAQDAQASFQPAVAGFATGTSEDVNINRNVLMSDNKFHIGLTDTTHASNKTMTIMGVKSLSTGNPIGYLLNFGVKPTSVDNAGMAAKVRQISADVPGIACNMMEQVYGAPTLYIMGATADQVPLYDAYRALDNGNGSVTDNVDDYPGLSMDEIFAKMTPIGTKMGNDAIAIARNVSYTITKPTITYSTTTYSWPAVSYNPGGNDYSYVGGTLNVVPVEAIRFGDAAFIGTKPEIDAVTEQELQAMATQLGYSHVTISSFLGGDAKYMPHAEAYGQTANSTLYPAPSVEAKKTGFAQGAAEELVTTSAKLLNGFLGLDLPDTTAPSAIYTLSTSAATSGPVVISILAYDDISGVAAIITPSGTIVQGSSTTYSVTTNGTYNFTVIDNAANTATISVTVSNIQ